MYSEVIKLTPQVDRAGLSRMVATLNQRFHGVAKKFGEGLKNVFKFGGFAATADTSTALPSVEDVLGVGLMEAYAMLMHRERGTPSGTNYAALYARQKAEAEKLLYIDRTRIVQQPATQEAA